jgi:hypothetical protein
MEHNQIVKAIQFIRPNAEFALTETDLTWLDGNQIKPTKKEIEDGWIAYQAAENLKAQKLAADKQAVLVKLGLTSDEVAALLG